METNNNLSEKNGGILVCDSERQACEIWTRVRQWAITDLQTDLTRVKHQNTKKENGIKKSLDLSFSLMYYEHHSI